MAKAPKRLPTPAPAPTATPSYSPDMEALAKQRGFRDANEMALFLKNREQGKNQKQTLWDRLDFDAWKKIHPSWLINLVNDNWPKRD